MQFFFVISPFFLIDRNNLVFLWSRIVNTDNYKKEVGAIFFVICPCSLASKHLKRN